MILYNIWHNYTTVFSLAKFAGFYFGVFKDSFFPCKFSYIYRPAIQSLQYENNYD